MKINELRKLQEDLKNELKIKTDAKLTFTVVSNEKLKSSQMWTAEFYDESLSPFNSISKEYKRLFEIADLDKGDEPGSIEYIKFMDAEYNDVPFIKTSEIFNYQINYTTKDFVDENLAKELSQNNRKGDILFTKDGKVGQVALSVIDGKYVYGSGLVRIRLKNEDFITKEFLFLLLSIKEFGLYFAKRHTVRGTTIPHLNIEYLQNLKIPKFSKEIILKYTGLINKIM